MAGLPRASLLSSLLWRSLPRIHLFQTLVRSQLLF
jgi:hypothetical protein